MKKFLPVLAIMLASCFASCNSFENKAKKRLNESMKQLAISDDYSIDSMNVVFSNDTVCVVIVASKGLGLNGEPINKWEYYLTKNTLSNGGCVVRELAWPMDGVMATLKKPFNSRITDVDGELVKDTLNKRGLKFGTKEADNFLYSMLAQGMTKVFGVETSNEGF